MFSLSELVPQNQHQSRWKLLKPWWEVFMDHLLLLMLMVSLLAGTEQLTRDQLVCVPLNLSDHGGVAPELLRPARLEHQRYLYVSQVCYREALPVSSRFLPHLVLLQTLVLVASGSFWLHFPHTSARIEHFLAILAKCCESPWTSQALSSAAQQENLGGPAVTRSRCLSTDGPESGSPQPPAVRALSRVQSPPSSPLVTRDGPRRPVALDRSDGERARALFEKVRKFRSHCEASAVIYRVYLAQTVFKLLTVTAIAGSTVPLLGSLSFRHACRPEERVQTGSSAFECLHRLSSLLRKLLVAYLSLLGLYGLLNAYALSWTLHSSLRQYSFSSLGDVPDLRNDLAFLLHMLDQYDPLLAQRLSTFLSPSSESRLLEEELGRLWGEEKLRSMASVDADGRSRLQLVGLPRLPPAVFSLGRLQVLKLERITEARFTAQVANMAALRELHLNHCTATVDLSALTVLQERLEVLHLTFTRVSEIPSWVLSLRSLHELHLSGFLSSEGGGSRGRVLGSLRRLRHLRVLVIRGVLQRIPAELCELAGSLARLEVYNEGARQPALMGLKRMLNLTELLLQGCRLQRLPSALLALSGLRTLDLQHNNLLSLEELLSLAPLRRLSCLRLACNRVRAVPASVAVLRGLELLDLTDNRVQSLPPELFSLRHLRRLLLAGNLLVELPTEVRALHLLTELDLSGNRLRRLPSDLFRSCLELRILNVAHNSLDSLPRGISALGHLCRLDLRSNSLQQLPAELGSCWGLHAGGLLVEEWLLLSLPRGVRDLLSCSAQSDTFPYFSPAQWSFSTALESQI